MPSFPYMQSRYSIQLPRNVFEREFESFLSSISDLRNVDKIDFKNIGYYMPAAIVALLCNLISTEEGGWGKVVVAPDSSGFRYFQRMNFFKFLFPNKEIPEAFSRHNPINFSPILKIDKNSNEGDISKIITSSIWGKRFLREEEKYNVCSVIQYAIGEIVRNVIQHSESHGYIASQYYPKTQLIRIGIADMGIGILESFKKNKSPFYNEKDNHLSMIRKALSKQVSSKTHLALPPYANGYENQGVGLTMLKALAKFTTGYFFIATGDAYSLTEGDSKEQSGNFNGFFQGTVCSIAFSRNQLDRYPYNELREDLFNEVMGTSDSNEKSESIFL